MASQACCKQVFGTLSYITAQGHRTKTLLKRFGSATSLQEVFRRFTCHFIHNLVLFVCFFVVLFRLSSVTSVPPGCDVEVGHADARQHLILACFLAAETSSFSPNSLSFLSVFFLSQPPLFCHVLGRLLPPLPPPSFHSHARVAASALIPFCDNADSDARCLSEPVSIWSRLTCRTGLFKRKKFFFFFSILL